MKDLAEEVNFDGLVGPTHNYAGLALGNIASHKNKGKVSNPRKAALQGLAKAKLLSELGGKQAILPYNFRPNLSLLRSLGFTGKDEQVIDKVYKKAPELLANCYSASSMWAANLATISPSCNTLDGKVHFSIANLCSNFHRAQEAKSNHTILKSIFADEKHFVVHEPLLSCPMLADEGAANHSYICNNYGEQGVELFVYGFSGSEFINDLNYSPRQNLLASQAVARRHSVKKALFLEQSKQAITMGAFHNDVVFVANENVILYHEQAFALDPKKLFGEISKELRNEMVIIKINKKELSLEQAINSYLFNSQIISTSKDEMMLIAPQESENDLHTKKVIDKVITSTDNPINRVNFVDCKQSMQNGGGPACLRLRVVLSKEQQLAVKGNIFLTDKLYEQLVEFIEKNYREHLSQKDLSDPLLLKESQQAYLHLKSILGLHTG